MDRWQTINMFIHTYMSTVDRELKYCAMHIVTRGPRCVAKPLTR